MSSPRSTTTAARTATSAAAPIVAQITDITADGMNVIFTLEAGNADFPFLMSDYHLPILPAQADGTIDPNTTDGCGPFRMDNIEFGVRADYTRHDGYWKEGLPYFDAIEQILIFDDAARQNALISGEVDYIDAVDLNTVALLERAPGINVLPSPAPSITASRWTRARRPSMTSTCGWR
jgi:peptide/nickel transport system substrate-binding protein